MRADAARNRAKLLGVAVEAFQETGIETSLEEIAKRAGVGIGTLYRHFPTRPDLVAAVYRHDIDLLCDGVETLIDEKAPHEALEIWIERFVAHVNRKKGMSEALHAAIRQDPERFAETRAKVRDTLGALLENAAAAGVVRADVEPEIVMRLISGVCLATDATSFPQQGTQMVALILDGLRYGA